MNNFFRAIIAAWGAKKLGGGCLSTVVIFIIIYTLLGKCNQGSNSGRTTTSTNVKTHALKYVQAPVCMGTRYAKQ